MIYFLTITKITCEELQCGVRSSGHPFCKTNPNGDATCQCLPGYKKIDNNQCVDIDECNPPDPYSQSLKKMLFIEIFLTFSGNRITKIVESFLTQFTVIVNKGKIA